ncbi:Phosphoenolpyruvate/pyruvate domain-containing protein [Atractiella rhizophila]|nr:Phosphoenolpyruvate/pyruvate domain-containing protein [Atractiella rhizophila]
MSPKANNLTVSIKEKKAAFGIWLTMPGTGHARNVALASPDISWILVDCEHGHISIQNAFESIAAIQTSSTQPPAALVRIPATGASDSIGWQIKLALDGGAAGIMVPMVETVEQAKEVVSWCRFPPQGKRGHGSPFVAGTWGTTVGEYLAGVNERIVVLCQIETPLGYKNVEEIAKVEGLDGLFIGPYDLSISHGIPIPNPRPHADAEKMIQHILATCKQNNKLCAIYCATAELGKGRAQEGFDLINITNDADVLRMAVASEFNVATSKNAELKPSY